jgi:hypothetical protein
MPRTSRRGVLIAGLLGAAILAGCGKGVRPGASGASPPTASGPAQTATAPKTGSGGARALTPARRRAFADAVNLTAADVPGFSPSSSAAKRETPAEKRLEAELLHCVGGLGSPQGGGERSSHEFKRRGSALDQSVGSAVSFAATPALAAEELGVMRSARVRACFTRYLKRLFGSSSFGGGAVKRVTIAQGNPPAPGSSGGFGWRITALVDVRGIGVPFYLDILGFVYREAEVSLMSSSVLVPFPAQAQEQLFRVLLGRATTHRL